MAAEIRPDAEGFLKLTRTGYLESFAQDLPPAEISVLFAAQAPASAQSLGGSVSSPAWKSKPSWYIVAAEDRAIPPSLERSMAAKIGARTISVTASQLVMLSHPGEVAALIIEAAG